MMISWVVTKPEAIKLPRVNVIVSEKCRVRFRKKPVLVFVFEGKILVMGKQLLFCSDAYSFRITSAGIAHHSRKHGILRTTNTGLIRPRSPPYPRVFVNLGSSASRNASPRRLKLIRAKKMKMPGRKTCSGAMKILVEALVRRFPQLGVGG
jgi:hypothetical protein